ncbi:MAG TPA: AI-2E family transporter [Aggregatilineales bacterium]|nr:AI-2E family transporter [Anaerolineales bacterium]HRE49083.1 AI-2E family transporter [Aggregatilineales bacterium]
MTTTNFSGGQIVRWTFVILAILIGVAAAWWTKDILMLTLTAIVFSILLTTPIRFFVRRGIPRPLAILLTMLLIIIGISVASAAILPGLLQQFQILVTTAIPNAWDLLQKELRPEVLIQRYPFLQGFIEQNADFPAQILNQIVAGLGALSGQVFPVIGGIVGFIVSLLIIIFLSLYFIADPNTHWRGMLRLIPVSYRPRAREILVRLDFSLRRFLQAQIIIMVLTGLATALGMAILGVPLSGALGAITGLFSFVPNFGPLIALIPTLAVAILNTPQQLILVLLVFFGIQTIVSQIAAPLMIGNELNMPPALILLSQLFAGIFFGFLGLLLSVPLAIIVIVLVKEVYVHDILGDTDRGGKRTTLEVEAMLSDKVGH